MQATTILTTSVGLMAAILDFCERRGCPRCQLVQQAAENGSLMYLAISDEATRMATKFVLKALQEPPSPVDPNVRVAAQRAMERLSIDCG